MGRGRGFWPITRSSGVLPAQLVASALAPTDSSSLAAPLQAGRSSAGRTACTA